MATKVMTFQCPASPIPNPANPQVLMYSTEAWPFSAIKGSPHQTIDSTQQYVKVGINTAHFSTFCFAFQETGGTKNVTVTHTGNVVNAIDFLFAGSNVHITFPDP